MPTIVCQPVDGDWSAGIIAHSSTLYTAFSRILDHGPICLSLLPPLFASRRSLRLLLPLNFCAVVTIAPLPLIC
jgi:hypothetical protein